MYVIPPLTKGHLSNNDTIVWQKGSLLEADNCTNVFLTMFNIQFVFAGCRFSDIQYQYMYNKTVHTVVPLFYKLLYVSTTLIIKPLNFNSAITLVIRALFFYFKTTFIIRSLNLVQSMFNVLGHMSWLQFQSPGGGLTKKDYWSCP